MRMTSTSVTTPARSTPTLPPPRRRHWCWRHSMLPIVDGRRRSTPGGDHSTWPPTSSPDGRPIPLRRTSSCATRWMPRKSQSAGGPATLAMGKPPSMPMPTRHPRATAPPPSRPRRRARDPDLGEFILDWDDVRSTSDPHGVALEFAAFSVPPRLPGVWLGSRAPRQCRREPTPDRVSRRGPSVGLHEKSLRSIIHRLFINPDAPDRCGLSQINTD